MLGNGFSTLCALDDQSSCPHTSPHRLTPREILAIKDMVTALEYLSFAKTVSAVYRRDNPVQALK
jgi:hypothetical protein